MLDRVFRMSSSKIFVHRFSNSNGVGKAAIALYENLKSLNHKTEIYCMQTTHEFKFDSNVHVFPLKLPYTVEVFVLQIWGFFVKKSRFIIHGFEIYLPNTSVYHLHFDYAIEKMQRSKYNIRILARYFAKLVTQYGFSKVVEKNILIVTPSELMTNRLKSNFTGIKLNVETIPNQLNTGDLDLLEKLESSHWKTHWPLYEKFGLGNPNVAVVANGDWHYKGLKEIDFLMEHLPSDYRILLIGGKRQPVIDVRHAKRIMWSKELNREQLLLVLRSMNGIVVASEFESFSMVALESVSVGVPTLILGQAGITEYYSQYLHEVKESKLIFSRDSISDWIAILDSDFRLQTKFNAYLTRFREEKVRNIVKTFSK